MCDVCTKDLLLGYQHINEDNTRDHSSFQLHRIGYDVCTPCAVKHIGDNRTNLSSWLNSVLQGTSEPLRRRCSNGLLQMELCLSAKKACEQSLPTPALAMAVDIKGTAGLYISVAVLPVDGNTVVFPDRHSWLSMGTSISDIVVKSNSNIKDGSVQFVCADGNQFHIKAADTRGMLLCSRSLSQDPENSSDAIIRAVTYRDSILSQSEHAHFLKLKGFDEECRLPQEGSSEILSNLYSLASQCGVAHNIPRQTAVMDSRKSGSTDMDITDTAMCPQMKESVGTASCFLVSESWATLSDCTICCSALGEETWIRGLPMRTNCGHFFHAKCLQRFYRNDASHKDDAGACPNCRAKDPLSGAGHVGGICNRSWTFNRDVLGQELTGGRNYMVAAVLCQDPHAVLDSALMFSCEHLTLD